MGRRRGRAPSARSVARDNWGGGADEKAGREADDKGERGRRGETKRIMKDREKGEGKGREREYGVRFQQLAFIVRFLTI